MGINISFILPAAFGVLALVGCECVGGPSHTFEQKIAFWPEQPEYKVGDTIWLGSSFSCRGLLNTFNGQQEDFCDVEDLEVSFIILLLEHSPQDSLAAIPAIDYFDFVAVKGRTIPVNSRAISFLFQSGSDDYQLKIGIIPHRPGKFASGVDGRGNYKIPGADRCETGSMDFTPDVVDNRISLLADFNKGIENVGEFEKSHCYCFEVK